MNKSILITGANSGLGMESARQLALLEGTEKVILACRNEKRAIKAMNNLEVQTGKKVFEILIMDVSNAESVRKAVSSMKEPVDAIIMNAGGMGGKTPEKMTSTGMNELSAHNLLGHVVLVDELIKSNKLKKIAMFASSEAARGVKKMGMKRPSLETHSANELATVLDGSYFGEKFDAIRAYGHVKYVGTLWMSSLSRKYPSIKFVSVSPGSTSGTAGIDNAPTMMKLMYKYIMMPVVLPLMGMVHNVEKGASRYLEAINSNSFKNGGFYASSESKAIGELVDQFKFFPTMANESFQDNANEALHRFIH